MIKVTSKIVDTQFRLIGLGLEGRAKDFGQLGNQVMKQAITLGDLVERGFSNNEVSIRDGRLIEHEPFSLRDIETIVYSKGKMIPMNVEICLKARVMVDGELAGFDVAFGDIKGNNVLNKRLRNKDIMNLSKLYRGTNFVVRHVKGTHYIAGRSGMSIEKLPEVNLSAVKPTKKASTRSVENDKVGKKAVIAEPVGEFSAISLMAEAKIHGAKVLILPGDTYTPISNIVANMPSEFASCGIEAAEPEFVSSVTSVNTTLKFKKLGRVGVEIEGKKRSIPTYAHRDKTLFRGQSLNIPRLALLVPGDISWIGNEIKLAFKEISDPVTMNYIRMGLDLMGNTQYRLLEVDTSHFVPMTKEEAKKHILKAEVLKVSIENLENLKCIQKLVRERVKNCKAECESSTGVNTPIFGQFAGYSEEALEAIKEAGIDPFTGMYTKTEEPVKQADEVDANTKTVGFSITYAIKGLASSPSAKALLSNPDKYYAKYPKFKDFIERYRAQIIDSEDTLSTLKNLEKLLDSVNKKTIEAQRVIWLHNMASYTLANYAGMGVLDIDKWTMGKPLKYGVAYEHPLGIAMKLEGANRVDLVDISKA